MLQAHWMAAVVSFIWYSNLGKLNIKEVFVQARKSTAKNKIKIKIYTDILNCANCCKNDVVNDSFMKYRVTIGILHVRGCKASIDKHLYFFCGEKKLFTAESLHPASGPCCPWAQEWADLHDEFELYSIKMFTGTWNCCIPHRFYFVLAIDCLVCCTSASQEGVENEEKLILSLYVDIILPAQPECPTRKCN